MIPIHLDPRLVRVGLVGRGTLAVRRLAWLRAGGCEPLLWSDDPSADLLAAAGDGLSRGLPESDELALCHVLWIADLPSTEAAALSLRARGLRVLVNVEDVMDHCDFHTPAVERRGALTLSAGTGGVSPAAAGAARERLAQAFPETWGPALAEVAAAREALRAQGVSAAEIIADARRRLADHGIG